MGQVGGQHAVQPLAVLALADEGAELVAQDVPLLWRLRIGDHGDAIVGNGKGGRVLGEDGTVLHENSPFLGHGPETQRSRWILMA